MLELTAELSNQGLQVPEPLHNLAHVGVGLLRSASLLLLLLLLLLLPLVEALESASPSWWPIPGWEDAVDLGAAAVGARIFLRALYLPSTTGHAAASALARVRSLMLRLVLFRAMGISSRTFRMPRPTRPHLEWPQLPRPHW